MFQDVAVSVSRYNNVTCTVAHIAVDLEFEEHPTILIYILPTVTPSRNLWKHGIILVTWKTLQYHGIKNRVETFSKEIIILRLGILLYHFTIGYCGHHASYK